jgi:hypothetical protein
MLSAPPVSAPTHFHVPPGSIFTIADEVADLMEAVGYQVDEPERATCRALFAQRPDGRWAGLESGIVAPRQNLKTATMLAGALHDTFVRGAERVVWTAHEFKTSSDAFKDFRTIIESFPWLDSEVLKIRTANGKEGFELRNGSRLDILARTGRSGRGLGGSNLYMDEALYLDGKMMGALVPTMSARPNAHIVYGSSPGMPTSDVLRELRDRGRSGDDPHLGWIEWANDRQPCASRDCQHDPGTPGCWLDDLDAVMRVNPAMPRRISVEYVRQERLALASVPGEYLRERMGVWEDPPSAADVESAIPMASWHCRADAASTVPDGARVAFAVDTSWDRLTSWIAVAGIRADGTPHVEVIETAFGTDWVVPWLAERVRRWNPVAIGLQGNGAPVSSLLEPLRQAFPRVVKPLGVTDLGRACGALYDAAVNGPLAHPGQEQLDRALSQAAVRPVGDSWVWDRKASAVDVAPLVAATEALYLLTATAERPRTVYSF